MALTLTPGHDILIVSSNEKFSASVLRTLSEGRYGCIEVRKSASQVKRELVDRSYDIAIVNTPLSDETGVDLGIDISTRFSTGVIIVTPGDISEDVAEKVTDYGIFVLSKPVTAKALKRSVRLMCALIDKLKGVKEKVISLEEKMEEIRIVNRAKWILIDSDGMSEEDAHRYIGKQAMDRCVSKGDIAREIIASHD
ncbi:MAG TPA: antitermination regulator [Lachnospiraceae bacterium]|nr:antitermination regulator [Lachnospiraceae bacterium]